MAQSRYQIFVSSTFRDLQDERQAVLNAILKLNQFPAGMEIFPAVNDTAWEHIEKVIEDSDYYVLIIGGKYGSIEEESGISYTEKEYDFAVSKNIPVLAFTHSDEESIPFGKVEKNEEAREKLKKFKEKVGAKHHWNKWKTIDELKENVITSLSMAFVMNPQKGWVKAGGIDSTELLSRLADLQKRYDDLVSENNQLKNSALVFDIEFLAQGNDSLLVEFEFIDQNKEIELSYNDIFFGLGEKLFAPCEINDVIRFLGEIIFEKYESTKEHLDFMEDKKPTTNRYGFISLTKISKHSLSLIEIQLQALELIGVAGFVKQYSSDIMREFTSSINTKIEKTWTLTEKGKKFYLSQKAIYHEKAVNISS